MATEIIAVTDNAGKLSSDIVAAAGTPVTLFLKSATTESLPPDARACIEVKSSGGQYFCIGELNLQARAQVIDGPGTYRVQKMGGGAFGVDQG